MQIREGTRVLVVGDHPWKGFSGEVIGTIKPIMGGYMWKVRLDNGMECGARDANVKAADGKE